MPWAWALWTAPHPPSPSAHLCQQHLQRPQQLAQQARGGSGLKGRPRAAAAAGVALQRRRCRRHCCCQLGFGGLRIPLRQQSQQVCAAAVQLCGSDAGWPGRALAQAAHLLQQLPGRSWGQLCPSCAKQSSVQVRCLCLQLHCGGAVAAACHWNQPSAGKRGKLRCRLRRQRGGQRPHQRPAHNHLLVQGRNRPVHGGRAERRRVLRGG